MISEEKWANLPQIDKDMINYTSIIDILRSGKYIDKTENIEDFIGFKHITLENCKGTGSSLFLKTMACFLDETVDTKDVFCHLEIGKSPIFDKEINSYQLVWLDFSDFKAQSFEEALKYIKEKMSDIYKYHYVSFKPEKGRDYRYRELEYALDIIEKKSSYKDLQYSFYTLLYQLKRNKAIYNNINKLAVLIDNLVRLETIAKENGYEKKMSEFIIGFIVEDIYKHCDVFFQIGDNKEETDGWFYVNKDMAYHNFYARLYDIHDRYNSLIVSKKRQYSFMVEPFTPKERDWISCIEHDRSNIQQAKLREKQKRQEQICLEKEKYSEVLSDNVPMLSSNLGIRDKHLDKQTYK